MNTKRKIGLSLVGVLVVGGLTLLAARDQLAQRAFDRAIEQNVGVDRSATLPDGINVYVCGSGSPMPDADRVAD